MAIVTAKSLQREINDIKVGINSSKIDDTQKEKMKVLLAKLETDLDNLKKVETVVKEVPKKIEATGVEVPKKEVIKPEPKAVDPETIKKEIATLEANLTNSKVDEVSKEKFRKLKATLEKSLIEIKTAEKDIKEIPKKFERLIIPTTLPKKAAGIAKNVQKSKAVKAVKKAKTRAAIILKNLPKEIRDFNKGRKKHDVQLDADRPALPPGKRISASGNVYWENRADESDVSRKKYPYLENGGYMAKGGQFPAKGLKFSTPEIMVLKAVYSNKIDTLKNEIEFYEHGDTRWFDEQVQGNKQKKIRDLKKDIEKVQEDIKFLNEQGYPFDFNYAYDSQKFLRELNDIFNIPTIYRQLFDKENQPSHKQYYDAYLKVYDTLDKFVEKTYGEEYCYADGGTLDETLTRGEIENKVAGIKLQLAKTKKQISGYTGGKYNKLYQEKVVPLQDKLLIYSEMWGSAKYEDGGSLDSLSEEDLCDRATLIAGRQIRDVELAKKYILADEKDRELSDKKNSIGDYSSFSYSNMTYLYDMAEKMSEEKFDELFASLSKKEKELYASLVRLGDEPKVALATTLHERKKPKDDEATWNMYRYAKGGKLEDWVENNAEKLINHYLPGVEPNVVFSQSELRKKGDYYTGEGASKRDYFVEICFGDMYSDNIEEINTNYDSFIGYAEDISDGKLLLDVEVLSDDEYKSITFMFSKNGHDDRSNYKRKDGGLIKPNDNRYANIKVKGDPTQYLLKELHKLQRDLNSSRLNTYREGDNSEEAIALKKEREVKNIRFKEVLKELNEIENRKMAKGGNLPNLIKNKLAKTDKALVVVCISEGNPDFKQYTSVSDKELYPVNSLKEASEVCRNYINKWDLGGGNWNGGQVYDIDGKMVGIVSYNGRVWEGEYIIGSKNREITGEELNKKWYAIGGSTRINKEQHRINK